MVIPWQIFRSTIERNPLLRLVQSAQSLTGAALDFNCRSVSNLGYDPRQRTSHKIAVSKFVSMKWDEMRHARYLSLAGFVLTAKKIVAALLPWQNELTARRIC